MMHKIVFTCKLLCSTQFDQFRFYHNILFLGPGSLLKFLETNKNSLEIFKAAAKLPRPAACMEIAEAASKEAASMGKGCRQDSSFMPV